MKKEVKNLRRLKEILLVLFENGFDYVVSRIKLKRFVPVSKRLMKGKKKKMSNPERLRIAFEKLGPTFIKLGQILSLRPDLLPREYIEELEKLQDNIPSFSSVKAQKIIEKELRSPIYKVFRKFETKPVASASIAQVHKAILRNGKKAAVKVRRPGIVKTMNTDIEIMLKIAGLLEKHFPKIRPYKPVKIIEEFRRWSKKEVNLRKEANNAERFYRNFKHSKKVKIPKVYHDLCTKKVFISEFIEGVELHNVDKVKRKRIDLKKVLRNGCEAMLKQVFIDGFFHADPHPGNILVLKKNKISFVDYGIVGYFSYELRKKAVDLVYGLVEDDADQVIDVLLDIGKIEKEDIDVDAFRRELNDIIEDLQASSLRSVKLSSVLEDTFSVALSYNVRMPIDFVLFGKTIVTLEGIGLQYDPEFRVIDVTKPFIERLFIKEKPKFMIDDIISNAAKIKDSLAALPRQTNNLIKRLQKGDIKVGIEDSEIRRLGIELDRSSNRLVYGMIIASLIIGSAWTVNIPGDPRVIGIHIIPFSFLAISFIVSILLLVSISKEKEIE